MNHPSLAAVPPLIIIGLDGGDWSIIDTQIARGELPALAELVRRGMRTELRSTLPPATLPAWSSFLCGAYPGDHGVVDMFVHPPHSYALTPATAELRRLPTFLTRLAASGLAVASLGVPGTYPPPTTLGLCISGFDAPGASQAARAGIHPPWAWRAVRAHGGWRYAVVNEQGRLGNELAAALIADLDVKERLILWAHAQQPWDVFFVHLQAADTAGHHLWHTYDPSSPRFTGSQHVDALPSVYRRLDTLIEHLLAAAPDDARVLVVSDHGMGGASNIAVHVNRVIADLGLLQFHVGTAAGLRRHLGRALRGLAGALSPELFSGLLRLAPNAVVSGIIALTRQRTIDFAASTAFSDELDYAPSVWLNRRGVFPQGMLDDDQAIHVASRIGDALRQLRHPDTHEPLIRAVHTRNDVFTGPAAQAAPDLVIEPACPGGYRPSFLPSAGPGPAVRRLDASELTAARGHGMPGTHRREGIFIAAGPGLPAMEAPVLDIAQAGALVFALAGFAPPTELPARLHGFWRELADTLVRCDVSAPVAHPSVMAIPQAYDAAERAVLIERLRNLGYIE